MNREDFIINVFCMVSDWMQHHNVRVRQRGTKPSLGDDEVITMEIVGEFLGMDTDKGIHAYFKCHWSHFFPTIGDRSAFVRQSANLLHVKSALYRDLARKLGAFGDRLHIVDGFPIPVCTFGRAGFSRVFKGDAAYGYCATKKAVYYGFKGHLCIDSAGAITGVSVTAANVDEREAALDFADCIQGTLLGDKGYIGKKAEFLEYGIHLETPVRSNMKDTRSAREIKVMGDIRRRVETVISQLAERLHIERVRTRDLWHFISRTGRKILAHTVGVFLNWHQGRPHLDFARLLCEN